MKMGKVPSEAGLEALSGAGASLKGQDVGALNAIIRVASCAGISVAQQWKLVDAMEKKGLGSEEFTKMITGYVLDEDAEGEEAKKPTPIHMGQFFDLACTFLDFNTPGQEDDIVDPDSRDDGKGDVAVDAGDDDGEDEAPNACAPLKALLDSIPWSVLTGINTAYALFATDIAVVALEPDADKGVAAVTLFCFCCFLFELVGNFVAKRDYGANEPFGEKLTMFCFLDIIGTFSLVPDFLILFDYEMGVPDQVVLARVARAARIGARLSRLTKVFRVSGGKSKFAGSFAGKGLDIDEEPDVASQVGAKVADGISKKVVILVILLLVSVPFFSYQLPTPSGGVRVTKEDTLRLIASMKYSRMPDIGTCGDVGAKYPTMTKALTYADCAKEATDCQLAFKTSYEDTVGHVCNFVPADAGLYDGNSLACQAAADAQCVTEGFMSATSMATMTEFSTFSNDPIMFFTWDREDKNKTFFGKKEDDTGMRSRGFRPGDVFKYGDYQNECPEPNDAGDCIVQDILCDDEGKFATPPAWPLEDGDCLCCEPPIVYHYGGMEMWVDMKEKSADAALLNIFYMLVICIIFAISSMVFMADLNSLVIEPVEGLTKAMNMISKSLLDLGAASSEGGEANYIENSVLKIVSLLQVSFGDAGQKIIQRNMSAGSTGLKMRQGGIKCNCVYGFSDIREFTATTEVLNENIVVFVNEFAQICHQSGEDGDAFMQKDVSEDLYLSQFGKQGGKANKNEGDAFLLIWKDGKKGCCADLALQAYRMAIQRIRDSETLGLLCSKPGFSTRFPPQEQPFGKYFPRMGFGLHYGWSIEGAVGSELKTDAIYLGPHVKLADTLEMNTKEYVTPILLSEQMYDQLSDNWKKTCRKIDRVIGGAITEPFDLYAANVASTDGNFFDPSLKEDVYDLKWNAEDGQYGDGMGNNVKPIDGTEWPESWKGMVDPWNDGFEKAVDQYLKGDWPTATASLKACLEDRPWDGPSLFLLQFMKETPKADFKGYGELK